MTPFRHIGRRHIHLDATDSTNNRAAELAHDPGYSGTAITADVQSQGRGQHGRAWQSEPGLNVLLSVLLFPPAVLRRPAMLTALAAVAASKTIARQTAQSPTIKWPNDVLVEGKKLAGILIEGSDRPQPHFIVGIGLNVNQTASDFERAGLPHAASLRMLDGQERSTGDVIQELLRQLDDEYARLQDGDMESLEASWVAGLDKVGRSVTIERMDATTIPGVLCSLSFERLELESLSGERINLRPEEVRHIR